MPSSRTRCGRRIEANAWTRRAGAERGRGHGQRVDADVEQRPHLVEGDRIRMPALDPAQFDLGVDQPDVTDGASRRSSPARSAGLAEEGAGAPPRRNPRWSASSTWPSPPRPSGRAASRCGRASRLQAAGDDLVVGVVHRQVHDDVDAGVGQQVLQGVVDAHPVPAASARARPASRSYAEQVDLGKPASGGRKPGRCCRSRRWPRRWSRKSRWRSLLGGSGGQPLAQQFS